MGQSRPGPFPRPSAAPALPARQRNRAPDHSRTAEPVRAPRCHHDPGRLPPRATRLRVVRARPRPSGSCGVSSLADAGRGIGPRVFVRYCTHERIRGCGPGLKEVLGCSRAFQSRTGSFGNTTQIQHVVLASVQHSCLPCTGWTNELSESQAPNPSYRFYMYPSNERCTAGRPACEVRITGAARRPGRRARMRADPVRQGLGGAVASAWREL